MDVYLSVLPPAAAKEKIYIAQTPSPLQEGNPQCTALLMHKPLMFSVTYCLRTAYLVRVTGAGRDRFYSIHHREGDSLSQTRR
jgi:hypothetical protein